MSYTLEELESALLEAYSRGCRLFGGDPSSTVALSYMVSNVPALLAEIRQHASDTTAAKS